MRILVCGGREFSGIDRELQHHEPDHPEVRRRAKEFGFVWSTLDNLIETNKLYRETCDGLKLPTVEIISGCATGPDSIALDWADAYGLRTHKFPADWKKHGKAAGPIRNQQMLDEGKPDLIVAFPGGKGTTDMVRRAKKAGVEVRVIEYV